MSNVAQRNLPEWTEYRKKNGLDPLGMQNSSVTLYQTLVPGIGNVTLWMRYYGLYAWLSWVYAKRIGDTNPQSWQQMIRRTQALFALIAQRRGDEGASAGWAGCETDAAGLFARTTLQVLPVQDGAESWPRLMGQILFGFFGGSNPAIRHVKLDALHDQLTDDILECWATCFWCLHACVGARCTKEEQVASARYIFALADKLYRLTALKKKTSYWHPVSNWSWSA